MKASWWSRNGAQVDNRNAPNTLFILLKLLLFQQTINEIPNSLNENMIKIFQSLSGARFLLSAKISLHFLPF